MSQAEADISYHSTLQNLANQYNTINWTLHTIFIPTHSLVLGWIVNGMFDGARDHKFPPELAFGGCLAGLFLVFAWRTIYVRHRSFVHVMYNQLHSVEDAIGKKGINFKVHNLIAAMDKGSWLLRRTRVTIGRIQILLGAGYLILGIAALSQFISIVDVFTRQQVDEWAKWLMAAVI